MLKGSVTFVESPAKNADTQSLETASNPAVLDAPDDTSVGKTVIE